MRTCYLKTFHPRHTYRFTEPLQFPDSDTEVLLRDSMNVYASQHQGVCIGPWLEDRLTNLIESWFPAWCCSHAQLTADDEFSLQSRSWDIVLHKPISEELNYPPPAYPGGSYPLIPKSLVAAVIDSKGYLTPSGLRKYCVQTAYDITCSSSISQFAFIGEAIPKILFCFTSTVNHSEFSTQGFLLPVNGTLLFHTHKYLAPPRVHPVGESDPPPTGRLTRPALPPCVPLRSIAAPASLAINPLSATLH